MVVGLAIGLSLGAIVFGLLLSRARDRAEQAEIARQQAALDPQRVIDFMHLMSEALGEGLTRRDLQQRIVHASILCTEALSACLFERTASGMMRGVAVEGLFPPHRPLTDAIQATLPTRAKFLEHVLKSEEFPVGEGIVGRVTQTGRGELLADAAADPVIVKHTDPALTVRSVIAVPMVFRDRFFGVLTVANTVSERPFTGMEFSLMQSLAEQAALSLHNAELLHLQIERKQLDLDLALASSIQQMLLPRETSSRPGLDVDARYQPAQKIGGDLYDVIPLSGSRLGIAVADVSGKGIPASLLMAICRTNLRQIAVRHDSPARVLIELNNALSADIEQGLYVTMLYAVIDPEKGDVTYARAGHELPLFARRDPISGGSRPGFTGSEGMPLAMVPDELFSSVIADQRVPFAPGDVLVLYTDGLTEAPNDAGKEFSGARLADAVRRLHNLSSKEINDGILAALKDFVGEEPPRDDLTLVTIRRK